MSEPFVGEIRMFAGSFPPRGWAFCDGQLLAVSQNDALFSLLGTFYGGDGRTTFALPDCRGRIPIHAGKAPGLMGRDLGEKGGAETANLTTDQLPSHTHGPLKATNQPAAGQQAGGQLPAMTQSPIYGVGTSTAGFNAASIANSGDGQSHTNMMPYLCVNFIIALFGIYPSRN